MNIVKIRRKNGTQLVEYNNNGGIGQLFVPRIGEKVFGFIVLDIDYEFSSTYTKVIVVTE